MLGHPVVILPFLSKFLIYHSTILPGAPCGSGEGEGRGPRARRPAAGGRGGGGCAHPVKQGQAAR